MSTNYSIFTNLYVQLATLGLKGNPLGSDVLQLFSEVRQRQGEVI